MGLVSSLVVLVVSSSLTSPSLPISSLSAVAGDSAGLSLSLSLSVLLVMVSTVAIGQLVVVLDKHRYWMQVYLHVQIQRARSADGNTGLVYSECSGGTAHRQWLAPDERSPISRFA